MDSGTFRGQDGTTIFYRKWDTGNTPQKGVIVISHGLGEHGGRYADFAEFLGENGYACAAMDHRGHGKSSGKRGHVEKFDEFALDLEKFVDLTRSEHEGVPLFLLGHSMGAVIVLYFVMEHGCNLDGLIISAPPLVLRIPVPAIKIMAGKLLSGILPALTLNNEIAPSMLSTDPETIKAYEEDPLVHPKISARLFTEMTAATDIINSATIREFPKTLFIQGESDPIVDPSGISSFAKKVSNGKLITYPGFKHESLNEKDRQRVYKDILNWLNETVSANGKF